MSALRATSPSPSPAPASAREPRTGPVSHPLAGLEDRVQLDGVEGAPAHRLPESLVAALRPASRLLQLKVPNDIPRVTLEQVRQVEALMQPGDILLTTDNTYPFLQVGTYGLLGSHYTHSQIYEGEGRLIESSVGGLGGEGIVRTSLEDRVGKRMLMQVIRPPYQSAEDREAALAYCRARLGMPYDYTLSLQTEGAFYCTELLHKALASCPHPIQVPLSRAGGRDVAGLDDYLRVPGARVVYSDHSNFWKNAAHRYPAALGAVALGAAVSATTGMGGPASMVAGTVLATALGHPYASWDDRRAEARMRDPEAAGNGGAFAEAGGLRREGALRDPLAPAPRERDVEAAIAGVLELRRAAQAGRRVRHEDLSDFAATTRDNRVRLFLDREYFESALVPAVMQAKESIHLAMLAFEPGILGGTVADALIAKKRENPRMPIRVILDLQGSGLLSQPLRLQRHVQRLRDAGVEVVTNNMVANGLEHRKVAILDSRKAFFGGACLADPYYASPPYREAYERALNGTPADVEAFVRATHGEAYMRQAVDTPLFVDGERNPGWSLARPEPAPGMAAPEYHDFGVEVTGSAVHHLQAGFLQSWLYHGRPLDPGEGDGAVRSRYFPPLEPAGETPVKMAHGVPGRDVMRQNLKRIADSARETLDVELAYIFIPEFVGILEDAARRGVRIRVVLPGRDGTDFKSTWYSFRGLIGPLMDTGMVEVYETHQYTHVKLMVADRRYVLASTGNPEPNSWSWAFDETALVDSPELARDVEERLFGVDFQPERSLRVTAAEASPRGPLEGVGFAAGRALAEGALLLFPSPRNRDEVQPALPATAAPRSHPLDGSEAAGGSGQRSEAPGAPHPPPGRFVGAP